MLARKKVVVHVKKTSLFPLFLSSHCMIGAMITIIRRALLYSMHVASLGGIGAEMTEKDCFNDKNLKNLASCKHSDSPT